MKAKSLLFTFSLLLFTSSLLADVPVAINYRGHLSEPDGSNPKAKVMLMAFRLYDRPGTGLVAEKAQALWGRQASVSLKDGDFDVNLKDTFGTALANTRCAQLDDAIAAALKEYGGTGELYLGLTPANDANAEIHPRLRLTFVPKAVQARAVRALPKDFVATNGVFEVARALVVNGATTLRGVASYADTVFDDAATVSFQGGVAVDGTLEAGAVSATTLEADAITVTTASTIGSGNLSVTGALVSAGTAVWNGDITQKNDDASQIGQISASAITGNIYVSEGGIAKVETLKANTFTDNTSTTPFSGHDGSWQLIGDWQSVSNVSEDTTENYNMNILDPCGSGQEGCRSISTGRWKAPCDCLALFQTYIENTKEAQPACIQFYIIAQAGGTNFTGVDPNAVATVSNGKGAVVESVVPLLLRKGQIVKWLCYNNNQADDIQVKETGQTKVTGIMYQPFGWNE